MNDVICTADCGCYVKWQWDWFAGDGNWTMAPVQAMCPEHLNRRNTEARARLLEWAKGTRPDRPGTETRDLRD